MVRRNTLYALSSAAMALPVFAAPQPAESVLSIRFSQYDESSLAKEDVLTGSEDRYDIDIGQFRLVTPAGRHWSLSLDASRETMSGASPWGTFYGFGGEPNLVMTGATIRDARTEVRIGGTYHGDSQSYSLGVTTSEEDDYESLAIDLGGEWDFNGALSTLSAGLSFASDDLSPTEALMFGRIPKASRKSRSASVSWSQIINAGAVLQAGLSLTEHEGYLSDPYKLRDVRPDRRVEWALSLKYRRFFDNQNAALHLDYRYYDDDWGIESHTMDLAWHQNLGASFQLVPRTRYYSQSESGFYVDADDYTLPPTDNQSSDFRLSGYGAWSVGLKAIYRGVSWSANVSVDRYRADSSYGHAGSRLEHPALLEFTLTAVGLDFVF